MAKHRFTLKDLETMDDKQILLLLVNDRRNELSNMYSPLAERLKQIASNLDKELQYRGMDKLSLADHVGEVTVEDPDTKGAVELSIYKDRESGGMFGVDSSFIEQMDLTHVPSPFNAGHTIELVGD